MDKDTEFKILYELHGMDKDEVIQICLKKDEMIEGLKKRIEGLNYAGYLYIGEKRYTVYVKEEEK